MSSACTKAAAAAAAASTLLLLFVWSARRQRSKDSTASTAAGTAAKDDANKDESPESWLLEVRAELYESVLPFWMKHSFDAEYGGFVSCLGRDGVPYDGKKYTWLNGRAIWMTAEMARCRSAAELDARSKGAISRSGLVDASKATAEFLLAHAVRPSDGQLWFCLTKEGAALHLERKPFSALFTCQGLGALSEVCRADGDEDASSRYFGEALKLLDRCLG